MSVYICLRQAVLTRTMIEITVHDHNNYDRVIYLQIFSNSKHIDRGQYKQRLATARDTLSSSAKTNTSPNYLTFIWRPSAGFASVHVYTFYWNVDKTWRMRLPSPVFCESCLRSLASGLWLSAKYDFSTRSSWYLNDVRSRFCRGVERSPMFNSSATDNLRVSATQLLFRPAIATKSLFYFTMVGFVMVWRFHIDSSASCRSCPEIVLSPVSLQTQSLALRALRKRKPQETQALALASSQSWLPLLQPSIPIGWRLRLLRENNATHSCTNATQAIAFEWKPDFTLTWWTESLFITALRSVIIQHAKFYWNSVMFKEIVVYRQFI